MKTEEIYPGNRWNEWDFEKLEAFLERPEILNQIKEWFAWRILPEVDKRIPEMKGMAGHLLKPALASSFALGVLFSDRVKYTILGPPGDKSS